MSDDDWQRLAALRLREYPTGRTVVRIPEVEHRRCEGRPFGVAPRAPTFVEIEGASAVRAANRRIGCCEQSLGPFGGPRPIRWFIATSLEGFLEHLRKKGGQDPVARDSETRAVAVILGIVNPRKQTGEGLLLKFWVPIVD